MTRFAITTHTDAAKQSQKIPPIDLLQVAEIAARRRPRLWHRNDVGERHPLRWAMVK